MQTSLRIRLIPPLRRLLAQYHDICEKSSMNMKSRWVSGPTREGPEASVSASIFVR